jgi:pilus assembly protein CpaC
MSLNRIQRLLSRSLPVRAATITAGAVMALLPLAIATPSVASDLDFTQTSGGQQEDSRYLRIGLAKSAIIKLPAAAKDVIVGDSAVVDVVLRNKTTAYLFGRSPAQTNVFFFDANGQEILHLDLEVTLDAKGLKKLIDRTIPGNKIQVDTTGQAVVLRGTASNAGEAKIALDLAARVANGPENIVNAMSIGEGDQVMLKVRVVEVKREIAKKLGVEIDTTFSVGDAIIGASSLNPIVGAAGAVGASISSGDFTLDATIEALERRGVLRTLAEPTLTSVSGQPALFHAGGEFDAGGSCTGASGSTNNGTGNYNGGSCGPTFKPYGVTLGFTPKVLSEGRIELKIVTTVSELDPANSTDNSRALSSRNAETTVELPSGGSMMLAGLIKDVSADAVKGTPGLMNLPVLGSLFRSKDYQSQQTEMVVIVTPYIVNPTATKNLATPGDRFAPPTDGEGYFFGRLNKVYGTAGNHPNGVYHGSVGYIIE